MAAQQQHQQQQQRPQLWLASASPRRAQLLEQLGITFLRFSVDVDEALREEESSDAYVTRVTAAKLAAALAVVAGRGDAHLRSLPVLAADTAVVLDGHVLGKPAHREEGLDMLLRLSGRMHEVLTRVVVALPGGPDHGVTSRTRVWWRATTAGERENYWACGESQDKAGAYAIQGRGAVFVERIEGSYTGVVGLPLYETAQLLEAVGVRVV